jgi:hypothetical protein
VAFDPSLGVLGAHAAPTLVAPLATGLLAATRRRRAAIFVAVVGLLWGLGQSRAVLLDERPRKTAWATPPAPLVELLSGGSDRSLFLRHLLQSRGVLIGDLATEVRIPALHGDGPFLWRTLAEAVQMGEAGVLERDRVLRARDQTLDVLAVRYILVSRDRDGSFAYEHWLRSEPENVLSEGTDYVLVERPSAVPFAYVAPTVTCAEDALDQIHRSFPDLSSTTLTDCRDRAPGESIGPVGGRVETLALEPGLARFRVSTAGDTLGLLVVSQSDYPGWTAEVDGDERPIVRANGIVQGVWVEPGVHTVCLRYRPRSFAVGVVLSASAILVFASIWLWRRRST